MPKINDSTSYPVVTTLASSDEILVRTSAGVRRITLANLRTQLFAPFAVTGSRGGNAALANLLTGLDTALIVDDQTSA